MGRNMITGSIIERNEITGILMTRGEKYGKI